MHIAELKIENFRAFGEGESALTLPLSAGLTAIVGENDAGKTAIIDALRLVLGTRGQEHLRVNETDYHLPKDDAARTEIRISLRFEGLTAPERAAFLEHLTYADGAARLHLTWKASSGSRGSSRKFTAVDTRSGADGNGPPLDPEARALLCATYLRPLRDAEQALSAGRGSRLSQILQQTEDVTQAGQDFDPDAEEPVAAEALSVLGIGDYANALLGDHEGIRAARQRLNENYLAELSFSGDPLKGQISVSGAKGERSARLRQLLEKLELELRDDGAADPPPGRGLGSNNLLFMASELLLLSDEAEGFPALLIEEPEAHLHPQRQLRLVQFLKKKVADELAAEDRLQVIVTTHSPNLASALDLKSLVLVRDGSAFPLGPEHTLLTPSDYGFLERFLDVTKANLFFARGVIIVEGDAENILIPAIARLLDRDLGLYGVSIVNVGGTGLGRFGRIFQRRKPVEAGRLKTPVACITDMDVMPDCAPEIFDLVAPGQALPPRRRWRIKADFPGDGLAARRANIMARADGQSVRTFVADEWTLEYDLAFFGLAREVWIAAHLADADENIRDQSNVLLSTYASAARDFVRLRLQGEELAATVYKRFKDGTSKAIAAQYLALILERKAARGMTPPAFRARLPSYLVDALDHATGHVAVEPV
ncbi:ATP-dependent nuclease [Bosea sp. 685]|uniref:ATP-dependent nuclease n=1 Tax=Bosea sp. 685 TaxID=3080057 RepID=UPI002892A6A8|nr:AAA family ATPase [Bosea sp. 685]WNJ87963.1 AAA family ATPase [Bosea sp. 685]